MKIRALKLTDIDEVRQLHDKYYPEFGFPDFDDLLNAFIIEDNEGIVMAGGVEQIAEVVLVTNKVKSRVKIGRALIEAQRCALFTCKNFGIREIYAFVSDDEYAQHLIKHGFSKHGLTALSMKVP